MKNSKKTKKLLAAISCLAMVENVGDMNGKKVYAGYTRINVPTNVNNTTATVQDLKSTKSWSKRHDEAAEQLINCTNCTTLKKTVELIERWGTNPKEHGRIPNVFDTLIVVPDVNETPEPEDGDKFDKLHNLLPVSLTDQTCVKIGESDEHKPENYALTIFWNTRDDIVEDSYKNIVNKWIIKAGNTTIVLNHPQAITLKGFGSNDIDGSEEKKPQWENQINNFINNHNKTWKCQRGEPIEIARLATMTKLVENLEKVLKANEMSTTKKVIIGGITAIGICAIGCAGYYLATKNGQSKLKKDSQKTVPTGAQENSHKGKN